ncbi:MAG: hypothetical protein V1880_00595 [Patescibacteria group bacterium]
MNTAGSKEKEGEEKIAPQAHALLDNLQGRITELETGAAMEQDKKKKQELELKKAALERALEARKSPITSKEQLADAVDLIKYDQFLLERLEGGSFDEVDLSFLMQSDLFPFFDDASQGKLAVAFEQMETNDFVQGTIRPNAVHVEQFPGEQRREVGFPDLMHVVSPEVIDKLKLTLKEAQFIRTERIREYLTQGYKEVAQNIENIKDADILSPQAIENLVREYEEAKRLLINENSDPALLAKAADNLPKTLKVLSASKEEMETLKSNRPAVEAKTKEDFARLKKAVQNLKAETADELLKKYQTESGEKSDSAVFRKAVRIFTELTDPDSEMRKWMAEAEGLLTNAGELAPEELRQIQIELNALTPKLTLLENPKEALAEALDPDNQDAMKAHNIIKELERTKDPQELRAVLETHLGAEHLELVPHSEFEKSYRQFSPKGDMVFQEEGNQWKIIIDESVFGQTDKIDALKKQLTHELLHLEFEKGKNVKAEVRKALVESNPEQWQKIRKAYIENAWKQYKKPPGWTKEDENIQDNNTRKARFAELWGDDDILSELYAAQNEQGQTWSKGGTTADHLNNLLVGAGVAANLGDIRKKTRGYEEGVEEGKPEESVTEVATQSTGAAVHKKNEEEIDNIRDRLTRLKKSDYIGMVSGAGPLVDAMDKYNEGTSSLNDDLLGGESKVISSAVKGRIEKVSKDLTDVEDHVGKAARKAPNNEISIFRKLWINTTFLSIQDFVQTGIDAYEFIQRRHKRKVADHAAALGMALFSGTDLGREALARKHKAESEEVNEWKGRYEHLDAWHLNEELKSLANSALPSADQLKAIIRILASKGRLNWRNEDLWRALNKLQSAVVLKPGDQMLLHDPVLLGQRLHRALGEVYDYDEYISLERQQGTTYTSEKQKYEPVHNRMQDKLTDRLNELLAEHRAGEHVDPILYESILEYCIKNGKSYAENVMFHLISGMAEGLLGPDRGLALGTLLNTWPPIDWFPTRQPPYSTADWKKFCKRNFQDSFRKGSVQKDFKNFFWTEIQNSKPVIERVKKSVGERAWDHDWARSIACLGDSTTAKQFLSGRSGQIETKTTAVGNAYVGAVQWLEENARNPQFATRESFARMAGWVAMAEGMLDRTAYQSKDKDINTRASESMNRDLPRENGFGNHAGANTRQHRILASRILFLLDEGFFSIFSGKEAVSDEQKKTLGVEARNYLMQRYPSIAERVAQVETIDQIYDRIDLIIGTMFEQMSEVQFQYILARLAAGA